MLYRRVAEAFPDAWIEDPRADAGDRAASCARTATASPGTRNIHSVADIEALPFPPRMVNVKPSRFGAAARAARRLRVLRRRTASACTAAASSSSGPGRGQIQYLASLFHPDTPNDVAPGGYNDPEPPPDGLPTRPLEPQADATGFRWGDWIGR